jgi:hypothetical protein
MSNTPAPFVAPHGLRACLDILRSKQRMPGQGIFGLWVRDVEFEADVRAVVTCTLVFGRGRVQRAAGVAVQLVKLTGESTEVSIMQVASTGVAGAGFIALGVLGTLLMFVTGASPAAKVIFLLVFVSLAVFGAIYNRALRSIEHRLPGLIREWLAG